MLNPHAKLTLARERQKMFQADVEGRAYRHTKAVRSP